MSSTNITPEVLAVALTSVEALRIFQACITEKHRLRDAGFPDDALTTGALADRFADLHSIARRAEGRSCGSCDRQSERWATCGTARHADTCARCDAGLTHEAVA